MEEMNAELIPVQGNPGYQERRECKECKGDMVIKDFIWESAKAKRVSMRCKECDEIEVATRGNVMFRQVINIQR